MWQHHLYYFSSVFLHPHETILTCENPCSCGTLSLSTRPRCMFNACLSFWHCLLLSLPFYFLSPSVLSLSVSRKRGLCPSVRCVHYRIRSRYLFAIYPMLQTKAHSLCPFPTTPPPLPFSRMCHRAFWIRTATHHPHSSQDSGNSSQFLLLSTAHLSLHG